MEPQARVGIIGGGLAGLAAAVGLASQGISVEVFEAKKHLGGRVTAIDDLETGEPIDYCQHVGIGCFTNFQQFCTQVGGPNPIERQARLHFFGPDGRRSDLHAIPGLPAPLHLAASFLRLKFLTWRERWKIVKALREIAAPLSDDDAELTALRWLRLHDQSPRAINRFWSLLLSGILGGSLERVSFAAARRIIIDAFLLNRTGFALDLMVKSPQQAIINPAQKWLESRSAKIHVNSPVRLVLGSLDRCQGLLMKDGAARPFDVVIVAAAWRQLSGLFTESLRPAFGVMPKLESWQSIPITGAHLWFDRPLTPLSHAILVEGQVQWVFRKHVRAAADTQTASGFYYQVVMNAAGDLSGKSQEEIVDFILVDLAKIWPASRDAKLLRSRIVTDPHATFSCVPGCDAWRPSQETIVPNLMLAGDWTQTGWPSTMEGAVRSGNLAAKAVLRYLGRPKKLMAADLPIDWLARRWFAS